MSKMSNTAILKCSQCGKPMVLSALETTMKDPDSEVLITLMRQIAQGGMCPACRKKHNYEVQKGGDSDYRVRPLYDLIPLPRRKSGK